MGVLGSEFVALALIDQGISLKPGNWAFILVYYLQAQQQLERKEADRKAREETERQTRLKEDEEKRKAAEETEKLRKEEAEKEEKERLARKLRVEAIMARTRLKKVNNFCDNHVIWAIDKS